MIYFFCGHRGSGKTYLANQVANETKIKIVDTGPLIRELYKKYNQNGKSFGEWITDNEKKYGNDFTNLIICKATKIEENHNYIIVGFRSLHGIQYFNKYFNTSNYKIIYIDGDSELFRQNYNIREKLNVSKEKYDEMMEAEDLMGINTIKEFSIHNSKYANYYYKRKNDNSIFEDIIKDINKTNENLPRETEEFGR